MPSVYTQLPYSGPISFLDIRSTFGGPCGSAGSGGLQAYTVPGCYTYIAPAGTSTMVVLLVGGGGAGAAGTCSYSGGGSGGGGAGGSYYYNAIWTVAPRETLNIHVAAGGAATTNAQSGFGGNTTITRVASGITITGYGGEGGFKSGQGGFTSPSNFGGGYGSPISTSTSLTTSHSAGGGAGAGHAGNTGGGSWASCDSTRAGAGAAGQSQCISGSPISFGGGGGGGSPYIKNGQYNGFATGYYGGGDGGVLGSPGQKGSDGFGGGGGGGGAGAIISSSWTQASGIGWVSGTDLYLTKVGYGLPFAVGTYLKDASSPPDVHITNGTYITGLVSGIGCFGGIGTAGVSTSSAMADVIGHWTVTPSQAVSTTTFAITGYYTSTSTQLAARAAAGFPLASGAGGAGGSGGAYVFSACGTCGGPVPIGSYYKGGTFVPSVTCNVNIPTSGAIVVPCNFYGARGAFIFTYCLPNGQFDNDFNLLSRAQAASPPYVNNGLPLKAVITINGVLGASCTSTPAFDHGAGWLRAPAVCLSVGSTGVISGAGASLTSKNACQAVGGHGVLLRYKTCISNAGIIQGGGGAGYPAGNTHAGGAGYYAGVQGATLFSGGHYQSYTYPSGKKGKSSSTVVGGSGGGYVSCGAGSPSVDGWGYGQGGTSAPHGGGRPGCAIVNKTAYAVFKVNTGHVRGYCGIT